MDFPKICTWAPFGPSAYLKQISEYFSANNSISDDKSSRHRQQTLCSSSTAQHPCSNCNAQPSKPLGVSPTQVNQPTCTTPPGTLAVVGGIPLSWSGMPPRTITWKGALVFCEDRAHTAHNTPQNKTTQHNTQTSSTPTAYPTTTQLTGGKCPRDSSYPGVLCGQRAETLTLFVARSRSCSLVLRL